MTDPEPRTIAQAEPGFLSGIPTATPDPLTEDAQGTTIRDNSTNDTVDEPQADQVVPANEQVEAVPDEPKLGSASEDVAVSPSAESPASDVTPDVNEDDGMQRLSADHITDPCLTPTATSPAGVTATPTPTSTPVEEVVALPATGQGTSSSNTDGARILLLAFTGLVLLATAVISLRRRAT